VRGELDVDPADAQGQVINRAREQARGYLRQGQSFVWNATNLSRQLRGQCIQLFADYHARIRIVYVEAAEERLLRQNRQRQIPVPESVLERLLDRWEVPDPTEAHRVEWVVE
jgi:predicted kinase